MAKARRVGAAVAVLFSLTGCTYHWFKPNATMAEFDTTNAACGQVAKTQAPYRPLYWRTPADTTITKDCDRSGRHCVIEKTYTPPSVEEYDGNEDLRDELYHDCMFGHGWVLKRDQ